MKITDEMVDAYIQSALPDRLHPQEVRDGLSAVAPLILEEAAKEIAELKAGLWFAENSDQYVGDASIEIARLRAEIEAQAGNRGATSPEE